MARETSWQVKPMRGSSVQLGWLAIFLASAFILVALLGYSPDDPTRLHPGPGDLTNPCGPVGANLADVLFFGLGYGAWSVFLGMVAAVLALAGRPLQPAHEWLLFALGLAGACGMLAVVVPDPGPWAAGGVVGSSVIAVLQPWLGLVGTLLACAGLTLFCLVAVFRISLQQVASRSVKMGEELVAWSSRAVKGALVRSFQGPPTPDPIPVPINETDWEAVDGGWASRDAGWAMSLPPLRRASRELGAPRREARAIPERAPREARAVPAPGRSLPPPPSLWGSREPAPDRWGSPWASREPAPRIDDELWASREPTPDRAARPWRRSPAPAARRTPPPPIDEDDTPLLPLVDPSEADSVFGTPELSDYARSALGADTRGRLRAVARHVPTADDGESDSMLELFPDVGPRGSRSATPMSPPLTRSPRSAGARSSGPRSVPPSAPRPGEVGERIVEVLSSFRLYSRVTKVWEGPVVTTVGVRPERHIDPEAIARRHESIAEALGVEAVRVVAWGGTRDLGLEVPTVPRRAVSLGRMLSARPDPVQVPVGLGVDVRGNPMFTDLAAMSHLMVVGQAGAGKSNALRAMVSTVLANPPSRGLGLVLMTPEAGLFDPFARSEHLVQPVVRRARVGAAVLREVCHEIDRRRLAMTPRGATPRDRIALAPGSRSGAARQPRWIVVVDRWNAFDADSSSLRPLVERIAIEGAVVGVHLVIAMRRAVTFEAREHPGRLALTLGSADESRDFLGTAGAEGLLGQGDALWSSPDGILSRVHVPDAGDERPLAWGESLPPG